MASVAVRRTNPLAFQGVAEVNPKAGLEFPPARIRHLADVPGIASPAFSMSSDEFHGSQDV
jgi:hypothetical protein